MNRIKTSDGREFVDVTRMSLSEWLNLLSSSHKENLLFIDYVFPNNSIREEYLSTLHTRSDDEVIDLLRHFLIPSGSLGTDESLLSDLAYNLENDTARFHNMIKLEFFKRMRKTPTNAWEGITWIIDLLRNNPKLALDTLYAYFIAHLELLPDGRIVGIQDAMAVIRGKFLDIYHENSILLSLDPYQFEHLINSLYHEMGYQTTMTQKTRDGGIDIIAEKKDIGEREKLLIQCKKQKKDVCVGSVRELLGVKADEKATKGVLVTTAGFTIDADKFANRNLDLELIG